MRRLGGLKALPISNMVGLQHAIPVQVLDDPLRTRR
jgi:hypothetical protein